MENKHLKAEFNFRRGYYGQPMGILAGEVLLVVGYYGQYWNIGSRSSGSGG